MTNNRPNRIMVALVTVAVALSIVAAEPAATERTPAATDPTAPDETRPAEAGSTGVAPADPSRRPGVATTDPAVAPAEPARSRRPTVAEPGRAAPSDRAMAEEVEIMRRILVAALGKVHPSPVGSGIIWRPHDPFSTTAARRTPPAKAPTADLQGVYLPGYGVVYQLLLEAPFPPAKQPPRPRKPSGPDEWDRIRRSLQPRPSAGGRPSGARRPSAGVAPSPPAGGLVIERTERIKTKPAPAKAPLVSGFARTQAHLPAATRRRKAPRRPSAGSTAGKDATRPQIDRAIQWLATRREADRFVSGVRSAPSRDAELIVSGFRPARGIAIVEDFSLVRWLGAPTREQVVEALIGVLTKYGPRFRQLSPAEQIAVAITYRPPARQYGYITFTQPETVIEVAPKPPPRIPPARRLRAPGGAAPPPIPPEPARTDRLPTRRVTPLPPPATPAAPGPARSGTAGKAKDFEAIGDLHMKQRNYDRAIEAYRRAIGIDPTRHVPTPGQAALYRKLIGAQVAAGKLADAKQLIDQLKKSAEAPKPAPRTPAKKPAPLDRQLIVSVAKGDLDDAAAKKITPAQLRKRISVRIVDPNRPVPRPETGRDKRR